MLATVDLGLIAFVFAGLIAACWAHETKKTNERVSKLEADLANLQSQVSGT